MISLIQALTITMGSGVETVLKLCGLTLTTSTPDKKCLVNDVSFSLQQGKTLALVGESGAGKSLTSLAVMGLLPQGVYHTKGKIFLCGQDIATLQPEMLRSMRGTVVSMIMQNPMSAFDPVFSIRWHFTETLRSHKIFFTRKYSNEISRQALFEAGLSSPDEILNAYSFQLSGGMLQRVMIALALITKPRLLIADEATTDLDPPLQKQIVQLLVHRKKELNLTILLITHDLSVAAALAEDIAIMRNSTLLEIGKTDRLFVSQTQPYTRALFAAHKQRYQGRFAGLFEGKSHATI